MNKNSFRKTIAIFLTFTFFFGLFPTAVFAQPDILLNGEIKGFSRSIFDSHFSKADRELNPERWLFEAKLGITQAVNSWETIACNLYNDPLLFNEAREKLEKWSSHELETRFSQWLLGRFFGEAAEKSLMDLYVMLGVTQKNYSWRLDETGNIIFDDITGDPMIIRPGDENDFSADLATWQNEADTHLNINSKSFEAVIAGLYTELLTYIPSELRESMSAVIGEAGVNITGKIKHEFENTAAREERIFTNRRTRDILSLRKKNDDEAARIFTEILIAETEEICTRGIEDISARIEAASAGTGDLALLGDEWLRLYKEQFDRGLKAWEEAEERFFIRRIEWEQDSFTLFSEGEKMWLEAFDKFEEERQKWELKAKELFQSGEQMFKNISQEFEKNIADAKHEFELNMSMRIGEGTAKIKSLVDMYLVCASAAVSAMESIQFWHDQYNSPNKPDTKDPGFSAWLIKQQAVSKNPLLAEIKKSYDLYVSYMDKALDARDRIMSNYAELFGTGALKDILLPEVSSEDFYLDEYQLALIKAKALVLYWDRKTAIAEAVISYAGEFSAGRMTEAEGLRAWENAKAAYNESLAIYETELGKLNTIGEDIQNQQKILHDLTQELQQAEETLNRLNSEYSTLVTASVIKRSDFYLLELNTIYDFLVEEYRAFLKSGDEAVYKTILEYGMKWDNAEKKETAELILDILINGDENQIPSLSKLEKNIQEGSESEIDLQLRLAALDMFYDSQSAKLRPLDSPYAGADWYSKAKDLALTDEEKAALYGEKLRARLTEDFKASSNMLLKKRLELELNSLSYYLTASVLSGEYILPEYIITDAETSALVYEVLLKLKDRIDLKQIYFTDNDEENEIINYFLSGGSFFSTPSQYLTEYVNDYSLCLGLLNIYNEYAFISPFVQAEYWNDTCISLTALYDNYGIEKSTHFLPDVKNIYASILEKPGDLIKNTAQFLLEFDECFEIIPQWLENEINNWKNSLAWFIAANVFYYNIQPENPLEIILLQQTEIETRYDEIIDYANSLKFIDDNEVEKTSNDLSVLNNDAVLFFYQEQINRTLEALNKNEIAAGGEKHWRQFLSDDYLTNIESSLAIASAWKEGILEDAYYNAFYHTNRLNDSFSIFLNKDIDYSDGNAEQFYNIYLNEISDIEHSFNSMTVLYDEISRIGRTYELSLTPSEEANKSLKKSYDELKAHENIFNALRDKYFFEAEKFFNVGSLYDEQYSILKKAYDNTDQKRFEYEKQDAIQRWASTAYLNTDHIDLENTKTQLLRAQTVLDVLSNIYTDESRRPYDNPEYNALYSEYEQSFKRRLKILETAESLITAIEQEHARNEKLFLEYQNALHQLGYVDQNYLSYISPNSRYSWSVKDIITVNNGRLAFSKNGSMVFTGVDAQKAEELNSFFNTTTRPDNEKFDITEFDEALRELSQRMAVYFNDPGKFKQWSLARDYLITSLINANRDLSFLNNYYYGLGQMKENGSLGSLLVKEGPLKKKKKLYSAINVASINSSGSINSYIAWYTLSEAEKADLEFYVVLALSGMGNNYSAGFSQMFTRDVYNTAYDYVYYYYKKAVEKSDDWYEFIGFFTQKGTKDVDRVALNRVEAALSEINRNVYTWTNGLKSNLSSIQNLNSAYIASCKRIDILESKKTDGQNVEWADINNAILETGKFNETDIDELKSYWEKMEKETGWKFTDAVGALTGLFRWAKETEEKNKTALENCWLKDAQKQRINEIIFQDVMEAYIAGNIDINTLKTAANNTYGKNAPAWKNHLDNMNTALINDLSMYLNINFNFLSEFRTVGNDITTITVKMLENRYAAEYSAREIEWDLMFKELKEKYNEWLNSSELIFENGRTDWNTSTQKMEETYKKWAANFQNEYKRVNDEWNDAYLAGLIDKEKWLEQAAAAANQASAESFLTLVGTEGERLSRFIDSREPFGIKNAIPKTEILITELLQSSGIANMYNAFGSINNIANTASILVRQGMGGVSIWDAALTKTTAADLARKTNAEIAERESRKLAYNARLAADEAMKNLIVNVDSANNNFRDSMDNMFILEGVWRRSGKNYSKDIVKGSTLFTPVVSDTISVTGYKYYKTESISLQTNMDENFLATLDAFAIRGLLENVCIEIETITAEIFGIGEDPAIIKKAYFEDRRQSPGKFGIHIGYSPAVKPYPEEIKTRNSIFYDEGSGELGRLMSEYIYWSVIDGKGLAELALAPWDKRIWNDEDSFFKAPTLRSVGSIAGTIAATAVSVVSFGTSLPATIGAMALGIGINTADDLMFNSLDVVYGYKTFGEAGFEFGKSLFVNTASSLTSGLFNGIGTAGSILGNGLTKTAVNSVTGAASKVLTQTAMTGLQTVTASLASNAIGAITYSSENGLGWSNETFNRGVNSILANTASSMVSTLTAGTLQVINSGLSLDKLTGFSIENIGNLLDLNGLLGSIAGQGVNYAMGSDFTLNALNLSMLTSGKLNSGLLELRFGRDGASMSIGAGGANISIDNLAASFKGAMVWNTNSRISSYIKKDEGNFDSAISLRGLYGFGDNKQKGELWDILKGDTTILTNSKGDLSGKTTIIDGKRTIELSGYRTGMSLEDQMRLAAILGHEAYRDGYKAGEIDSSGNLITAESNFDELRKASIARIGMSDRINQDYDWFYGYNKDFLYEKDLLALTIELGEDSLFDYYLQTFYDNSADNFFRKTFTNGNFQNENELWRNLPLLNAKIREDVNRANALKLDAAFKRYKAGLLREKSHDPDFRLGNSEFNLDDPELFEYFKGLMTDKENRKRYGYEREEFESIYLYACRLLSTKYAAEALTGLIFDTVKFHDYINENRFFSKRDDMSMDDMAKTINSLSNGLYNVTAYGDFIKPKAEDVYALNESTTMYLACLKVTGESGGAHFVMLSDIEFSFDENNNVSIKQVNVANPWNGDTYTGKQSYTYDEIERWDIFEVTQTIPPNNQTTRSLTTLAYSELLSKYNYPY